MKDYFNSTQSYNKAIEDIHNGIVKLIKIEGLSCEGCIYNDKDNCLGMEVGKDYQKYPCGFVPKEFSTSKTSFICVKG